jgi:hypothetical protein
MLLGILGCAAFVNLATPCRIHPQVKKIVRNWQAEHKQTIEPNIPWPYDSLWHAGEWRSALAYVQEQRQQQILSQLKVNTDEYTFLENTQARDILSAQETQKTLFSPEGVIGGTILPGLGITLGLMIKRPGDITKEEHKKALAEAKTSNNATT